MKTLYSLTFLLITVILLSISSACRTPDPPKSNTTCIDTNCEDYSSQQEAQRAFEADPECRNDLDHDNDGIACEHLNNVDINNCPTTANCGCSRKRKTECQGDPCCQWIVGEGCRCK